MSSTHRKLRVAELYAGTGRTIEPYRKHSRFETALLADISTAARDTYLANNKKAPYAILDLATTSAAEIERQAGGKIDILLGCPPCQGFSESGLRNRNDPRNDHMIRFARTVRTLRPTVFALENVPLAAVSSHFRKFRQIVEEAGYETAAAILNAAQYGSSQVRQRLVVVGRRGKGNGLSVALPEPSHAPIGRYFDYTTGTMRRARKNDRTLLGTTSSAWRAAPTLDHEFFDPGIELKPTPRLIDTIGDLPELGSSRARRISHVQYGHSESTLEQMETVAEGGRLYDDRRYHGAAYGRLHRKGLAKTITCFFSNAGGGRFWHPTENRCLTLREAARIQGFDDGFHFPGTTIRANAWLVGNALDRAIANASFAAVERLF